MKKLLSFLLIACMCFTVVTAFTGCGDETDGANSNNGDTPNGAGDAGADTDALSAFTYTQKGSKYCITGVNDNTVTSLVVPDSVTEISLSAFAGCNNLESITLPASLFAEKTDSWNKPITTSVAQFFDKSETSDRDGNQIFTHDHYATPASLKTVTIAGELEDAKLPFPSTNGKDGDYQVTYEYTSVETIIFTGTLKTIGNYAFRDATSVLKEVSIPNTVTTIGSAIFEYQKTIQFIRYAGTKAEWEAIEKAGNWFRDAELNGFTVHCTDGDIVITTEIYG